MRTRLTRNFPIKKLLAILLAVVVLAGSGKLLAVFVAKSDSIAFLKKISGFSAALTFPEALVAGQKPAVAPPSIPETAYTPPELPKDIETASSDSPESMPEDPAPDPTSEPTVSEPPTSDTAIKEPEIEEDNRATLVHKTYTAAPSTIFIPLEHGFIKNCTSYSADEILTQIKNPPYFTIEDTTEPQVLIMHTHATESYLPFTGEYYDKTYSSRSTNNEKNMVAVGDKIEEQLKAAGIGVIHDATQHDYPSYNGSYDRSVVTVQNYLKKYPSIKVVLDVHRDAIISGDTVTAPVVEIGGKTAAQVMIINGCGNQTINYPEHMKNLSFSTALQNQMEGDYAGFTRPILFDYRKYNQHLTTGSILLEVGGHGNTLEQALYSGELIGKSLGKLLKNLQ